MISCQTLDKYFVCCVIAQLIIHWCFSHSFIHSIQFLWFHKQRSIEEKTEWVRWLICDRELHSWVRFICHIRLDSTDSVDLFVINTIQCRHTFGHWLFDADEHKLIIHRWMEMWQVSVIEQAIISFGFVAVICCCGRGSMPPIFFFQSSKLTSEESSNLLNVTS